MSLFQYINKYQGKISQSRAQDIALKLALAVENCHNKGICLRNLESSGILMSDVTADVFLETSIPRISRLNKAQLIGFSGHTFGQYGDIRFRAPEVCNGQHYDFAADLWSLGIIIFQLLTGHLPFDDYAASHMKYSTRKITD